MILQEQNIPRVRVSIENKFDEVYSPVKDRDKASEMLNYHDGNDIQHIKEKMAERFASEVTRTKDSVTGEVRFNQVKTRPAQIAAINNNMFETIVRGMTRKISSNVADLFENSLFKFAVNGKPDEELTANMEAERQRGSFYLRAARMDEISVVTGSSPMLTQILNNKLNYQPMAPDKTWIVHGKQIKVSDEKNRPVDHLDIGDALCVVVQLDTKSFCAYFGRSDIYPKGRFVKYSTDNWGDIPEAYASEADEYLTDAGEIANPLTYWQDKTGDYNTPEYPIITWLGSPVGVGKCLLPVQTSLYESSKEVDLSASRTTMSANKAARGSWFFSEEGGMSTNQPNSVDEGVSKLTEGQSVFVLSVPSANITVADDVNKNNTMYLSDQWGLPAYQSAISENSQVPSGSALLELTKPSVKMQQRRVSINNTQMDRQFQIEWALMSMESTEKLATGVKQFWIVSPVEILKTKKEQLEEYKLEKAEGLIDNKKILVKHNPSIETEEDAQKYLDELDVTPPSVSSALGAP